MVPLKLGHFKKKYAFMKKRSYDAMMKICKKNLRYHKWYAKQICCLRPIDCPMNTRRFHLKQQKHLPALDNLNLEAMAPKSQYKPPNRILSMERLHILRSSFPISTWLLIGATLQSLISLIFTRYRYLPPSLSRTPNTHRQWRHHHQGMG